MNVASLAGVLVGLIALWSWTVVPATPATWSIAVGLGYGGGVVVGFNIAAGGHE